MLLILLGGWIAAKAHPRRNIEQALPIPKQFQVKRDLASLLSDARKHRSPSAGWPEGAMAYWLGIALSGPRIYDGQTTFEPYVNEAGRKDIGAKDIKRALTILKWSCWVEIALVALIALTLTL
jgi:adenosylcobinamide-phosphate synthase